MSLNDLIDKIIKDEAASCRGAFLGSDVVKFCCLQASKEVAKHGSYWEFLETCEIPKILCRAGKALQPTLPENLRPQFPEKFVLSIKPGSELALVWPAWCHYFLIDPLIGIAPFTEDPTDSANALAVAGLFERWTMGDKPTENEWIERASELINWACEKEPSQAMGTVAAVQYMTTASSKALIHIQGLDLLFERFSFAKLKPPDAPPGWAEMAVFYKKQQGLKLFTLMQAAPAAVQPDEKDTKV